jgi:hypothetical protein
LEVKRAALLLSIFVFALSVFLSSAQAATIAAWDMYGEPGDQLSTDGIDSLNVTAYDMVRGSGLTPYATNNAMSSIGWDGINSDDYIEIGFSVLDGYEVTLDELWIGTRSSNTGPGTIGYYSSLDGYTNPFFTSPQTGSYVNSIIDLSGLGSVTGDFYVRLFEIGDTQADGSGATSGAGTFRITDHYNTGTYTDVQFTGTTSPVPVPGAVWLLGGGLIALLGIRRKNA